MEGFVEQVRYEAEVKDWGRSEVVRESHTICLENMEMSHN